jgi:hypothetical protein
MDDTQQGNPAEKPTFEQEFGAPPAATTQDAPAAQQPPANGKPTFEQEFGAPPASSAEAAPDGPFQRYIKSVAPAVGRILAFNAPAGEAIKATGAYLSDPETSMFGTTAFANRPSNIPDALLDPAALIYDATFRPMAAVYEGIEAGLYGYGSKISPALGRDMAMAPQAFPFGVHESMGIPHTAALENYAARAPENVYMGTVRPTIEQEQLAAQAAKASYMEKQRGLVNPEQGPGVHEIAHTIEPEVIKQKEDLETQQLDLRDKVSNPDKYFGPEYDDKLSDLKAQAAEHLSAPTDLSAEDLQKHVEEGGKRYEAVKAQISELGTREDYIKEQKEKTRQEVIANDEKLRDIAASGKVQAAYKEAGERVRQMEVPPAVPKPVEEYGPPAPPKQWLGPWDNIAAAKGAALKEEAASPAPKAEPVSPWNRSRVKPDPANPAAKFVEKKNIDKAGNIRVDLLNTPEDIDNVLRETANENDNFMAERRGVLSNGQILDFADAMGMNPAMLDMREIGRAFNAEQIVASTKLMIQSAGKVREALLSGDREAYIEAKERHAMIQGHVSGATAEAGRALNIFRALKKIEGYDEATALGKFLNEQDNGKTLDQLQTEMKYAEKLTDPKQLSRFLEDSKNPKFKDRILYYYLNALLSGPMTHLRYSVGNMLNALATPLVEIPLAAGYGALREAAGMKVENRVYLGEAGAQLYAMGHGATEGMRAAIDAWQNNFSAPLPKERGTTQFDTTPPIPGVAGKVIGVPMRSVGSIHSFSKTLRYEQNIAGLAYRQAMKEKLDGDAFINRVSDLTSKPTDEMMESATHDALKETYMAPTDYHSFMGGVQRLTNDYAVAKVMVPFAKVGGQITKQAFLERTPVGIALNKEIRENLLGKNGDIARDIQAAKMTAGVAVMSTGVALTLSGHVTGGGPEDPELRNQWLLTHKPYHITIGPVSVSYRGAGPYAMLLGTSANLVETSQGWDGKEVMPLVGHLIEAASKDVLDANFMRGIKDALDAAYHPDEYGERYLHDFATNWLPFSVGLGQVDRAIDPFERQTDKSFFDALRAKIPGVSEGLYPRRDSFGQPIMNGSTYESYKADPVIQRLDALHMGIGKLEDKINGVKLTGQQYDDYAKQAGNLTHVMLGNLVQQGLQFMPPGEQVLQIKRTVETAREIARNLVKFKPGNENIVNEAIAKKQAIFAPTTPMP